MRIEKAATRYESMVDQDTGLYLNVQPSYVPQVGKEAPRPMRSFITGTNIRGSGVGDIRFYDEGISDSYQCQKAPEYSILQGLDQLPFQEKKGYESVNYKCELPIKHKGDLRASWWDECEKETPRGIILVPYQINLAFQYGSHQIQDWGCDVEAKSRTDRLTEGMEPVPILAAAERLNKVQFNEGSPEEIYEERYVSGQEFVPRNTKQFTSNVNSTTPHFYWTAESGNFSSINYNYYNVQRSRSKFLEVGNPILEENNKTAIAMAKSEILESSNEVIEPITDSFPVAAREAYGPSEVHLISMLKTESVSILNWSDDANGKFYMNLTDKATAGQLGGGARIIQLGGFTGNDSFRQAYPRVESGEGSSLRQFFENLGNFVTENFDPLNINDPGVNADVAWIANPRGRPSNQEIVELKKWLNDNPNSKLVITFGDDSHTGLKFEERPGLVQLIRNAEYLCEELGLSMKPYFISQKSKYATLDDTSNNVSINRAGYLSIYLRGSGNSDLVFGERGSASQIENDDNYYNAITVSPAERSKFEFIAIEPNNANTTLYIDANIMGTRSFPVGTSIIRSGQIKATFNVEPNKYYRMFFEEVSNFPSERGSLKYTITNCDVSSLFKQTNGKPGQNARGNPQGDILDYQAQWPMYELNDNQPKPYYEKQEDVKIGYQVDGVRGGVVLPPKNQSSVDDKRYWLEGIGGMVIGQSRIVRRSVILTIPEGVTEIDLFVSADNFIPERENPIDFDSWRLVGVSGIEIEPPFDVFGGFFRPVYSTREVITPAIPPSTREYTVDREISNPSHKYCPSDDCIESFTPPDGGDDIADGPVVAAQEQYFQAPFEYGAERSCITVITDASMIQGLTATVENDSQTISPKVINFIRQFYRYPPDMDFDFTGEEAGLRYTSITKVVSPEKSSPARLLASEENEGFNSLFGGYNQGRKSAISFGNDEVLRRITEFQWIMPSEPLEHKGSAFVEKRVPPPTDTSDEAREAARDAQRITFSGIMASYGCYSKFNVEVNGERYYDTGMGQLPPNFMQTFGHDFLDFDQVSHLISGYPGDLFGYNVKIDEDDVIYAGSPFAAFSGETITPWSEVVENTPNGPLYNAQLGYYGGAGAVYKIEKTMDGVGPNDTITPWTSTGKVQPNSLSVGNNSTRRSDRFGSEIVIDADFMAISAPDHSDDSLIIRNFGDFVRKEFNDQFSVGTLETHDTGDLSLSQEIRNSGQVIENAGAVYTYERKIKDWGTKQQDWVFLQKVIAQGYNSRYSQNHETEAFARSIAVSRTRRSDSDYDLIVGAPLHQYGSGVASQLAPSGGALYSYDAMMRRPKPSFAHPDTNVEGRIYGLLGDSIGQNEKYVNFDFRNNNEFDKVTYEKAVVYASTDGEIFIEASGQDRNDKGYAIHRPFIKEIRGAYKHGVFKQQYSPLFVRGKPPTHTGLLPLFAPAPGGNVYNNMSMFNYGVQGIASGDMSLFTQSVAPSSVSDQGFNLYTLCSGVSSSGLDLYVRGKF
jgi:hypothetical protein